MPVSNTIRKYMVATDVGGLRDLVERATAADVDRALSSSRPGLAEFASLLSTSAAGRLEDLAQRAPAVGLTNKPGR